ncbi:MAG: hypothetical protein MZW92_14695 [Comamonadaceae bacterium]|nr:hypothetical protein [Comamonadaceae bacterium]
MSTTTAVSASSPTSRARRATTIVAQGLPILQEPRPTAARSAPTRCWATAPAS